ncbi:methionine--tRNA ligase [Candidatus Micrarchaeota archaeon]|nr:methionine--tRNA ligase [Candidatus Micrarchaeota archaeon]
MASFEDFKKIELIVGRIESASRLEGTDKLMRIMVDIGSEKRQLIAGVAKDYKEEELVGKSIIVLANLEPKVIKGYESQGMLLAADAQPLALLTVDKDVAPGTVIR